MVIVEQPRVAGLGIIFFVHYVLLLEKHRLSGYYVFIVFFQNGLGHLFYMLFSLCDRNNALHVYVYDCTCISWKNRFNALHVNDYDRFMYQLYIRRWILALILQVKIPTDL